MKRIHSHCMSDEELRLELVVGDAILFRVEGLRHATGQPELVCGRSEGVDRCETTEKPSGQ